MDNEWKQDLNRKDILQTDNKIFDQNSLNFIADSDQKSNISRIDTINNNNITKINKR